MAVETVPGPFSGPMAGPTGPGAAASAAIRSSIKRRYAAERRFRAYGIAAILFGLTFLAVLFASIVSTGYTAFVQSSFELNVLLDRSVIDPGGKREQTELMTADYTLLAKKALASAVGADPANKAQMREIGALLSRDVDVEIRKVVLFRILQAVDIAALVAEFQRIERHFGRCDLVVLAFVEDGFQPRVSPHPQMVVRARNDELIGLDILVEHHLPGFRAFYPKILRDLALVPEVADFGTDDVIDPIHFETPLTLIPSIR